MNHPYLWYSRPYLFFLVSGLTTCLLTSCGEEDQFSSNKKGHLSLQLQAASDYPAALDLNQEKTPSTKAGAFGNFNPEDYASYYVDLFKGEELFQSYPTFGEMPQSIELPEGRYTIQASKGNNFPAAFEEPYFSGSQTFQIADAQKTTLSITTALANTKVDVAFTEAFVETFEDFNLQFVTSFMGTDTLSFAKTENRAVYFQSANTGTPLSVVINVKPRGKSWLKTKQTTTIKPQEYVHFNLKTSTEDLMGKLGVEVTIDETTIDTTLNLSLPGIYLPLEAPAITLNTNRVAAYEGVAQEVYATLVAPGGFKDCRLYVNSPELLQNGWEAVYDLTSLNDMQAGILRQKGIAWNNINHTSTLGMIEFDNLIANLVTTSELPTEYQFALVARDPFPITGKSDSVLLSITITPPAFLMNMTPADTWATKATLKAVATAGMGNTEKITGFRYSIEGGAENYVSATYQNATAIAEISGLTPAKAYSVYAVYGSHVSQPTSFTTETALQVENAGLEDWSERTRTGLMNGANPFSYKDVTAYYPNLSGAASYWSCVNQKTFEGSPNVKSTWNIVPSTKKTTGRSGNGAQLRTVGWDNGAGNTTTIKRHVAAGKLFMGTYSFDHSSNTDTYNYGQPFTSRPARVAAYLKYSPKDNDSYKVWAVVENRENGIVTQLGKGELSENTAIAEYTQKSFDIIYTNTTLKATHFYIVFSSSANCSDTESVETGNLKNLVADSSADGYTHHEGSNLYIDDIQIFY